MPSPFSFDSRKDLIDKMYMSYDECKSIGGGRMTLRQKIILLGMLAVVGFMTAIWQQYHLYEQQRGAVEQVKRNITAIRALSYVVHELQIERGMTSMGSVRDNQQALSTQIQKSDAALAGLRDAGIDSGELSKPLMRLRASVVSPNVDLLDAFSRYSTLIRVLIDKIESYADVHEPDTIEEDLLAYIHLITAKEYLGQIRAIVGHWIEFNDHAHADYQSLLHIQQNYAEELRRFRQHHSPLLEWFDNRYAGDDVVRMQRIVAEAITNDQHPQGGMEGGTWFALATAVIDRLKDCEDQALALIVKKSEEHYRQTQQSIYLDWFATATAGIVALLMMLSAAGSLMRSLNRTVTSIQNISTTSDHGSRIPVESSDEIGEIASKFNELLDSKERLLKEIETHRDELETRVAERTQELEIAKSKVEAANVAKSAFLANMSHEMRTPLHQITGLAQLVRRDPLTPKQADRMDKLDYAARNMTGLVETILELTKIEANKVEFEGKLIAIDNVVSDVVASLRNKVTAKGLQVKTEAENLPTNLIGDSNHIRVALLHYVDNAVRFTESGSVAIRVKLVEEDATSTLLRFEVEDSGIGIAPGVLPRLFNIFEQADNSSTRKYGGTGVGLAMTKKIAQLMGGDAGCESKYGAGSTFWFTVRLQKLAAAGI